MKNINSQIDETLAEIETLAKQIRFSPLAKPMDYDRAAREMQIRVDYLKGLAYNLKNALTEERP